jgi:hypothetical protein
MTIVKPSDNGILKANLPYFNLAVTDIKLQCFSLAKLTFIERFKGLHLKRRSPLDVLIRPDSQYGGGYNGTKAENVSALLPAILEYCGNPSGNVMWTMAGKVEHLPYHKVHDDLKQRTICYPPGHFDILAKTLFEPFTEAFLEMEKQDPTGCAYTKSIHGGGFHAMINPLSSMRFLCKGDISGFDRSHIKEIWDVIEEVMKMIFPVADHPIIAYVLGEMWKSLVFMPNGEVVFMLKLKSGSPATTFMNCLVHLFIFMYMYYRGVSDTRSVQQSLPCDGTLCKPADQVTWSTIYEVLRPLYYGDDHVLGTDDAVMATFSWRSVIYAELGFKLKKEDDYVVANPKGVVPPELTFLGNSPRRVSGRYVPVGNCEKYAQVFLVQSPNSSPMARASQLYSYCLMSCFDDYWFGVFKRAYYTLAYNALLVLPPQAVFQDMISGGEAFFLPPQRHGDVPVSIPVKNLWMDVRSTKTQSTRRGNSQVSNSLPCTPGNSAEASLVQIGNLDSRLSNVASRHKQRRERIAEHTKHKKHHKRPQERRKNSQGENARARGGERADPIQRHPRESKKGGSESRGTAPGKPGVPRLDMVRYQEPRFDALEDGTRAHTPLARGNIGVAHSYSHGKNRSPTFTKYRSKEWMGHSGIVFTGSELFDTFTDVGTQQNVIPTMVLPLAPTLFVGTKLAEQAKLWQFWRVREFKLRFISALPTTIAGQLFLAYLDDVEQDIFAGPNTGFLRKISALKNIKQFQAWESHSMVVRWEDEETPWNYSLMNGEDRLQTQGMLAAGIAIPVGIPGGNPIGPYGLVEIEYTVEFCDSTVDSKDAVTNYAQSAKTLGQGSSGAVVPTANNSATLAFTGPFWEDCTAFIIQFMNNPGNGLGDVPTLRPASAQTGSNTVTITQGTVLYAMRQSPSATAFLLFDHCPSDTANDPLVWESAYGAVFTTTYIVRPAAIEL